MWGIYYYFFYFFPSVSEAEHLGLPYLSGYLDSIRTNFRHGANFATGGATIRPQNEAFSSTGVSPFSLDIQIVQFDQFKARSSYFYNQGYCQSYPIASWIFLSFFTSPRIMKLYICL